MKIVDNANTSVEFSAVKVGDCFYYDRCLFIKINPVNELGHDRVANAFCFVDNNITHVPESCLVIHVDAEIVIKSKGVE